MHSDLHVADPASDDVDVQIGGGVYSYSADTIEGPRRPLLNVIWRPSTVSDEGLGDEYE